ncbi:MAG: hypothetical protein Q9188_001193 [Gyalolechia gomerana]
MTIKDTVEMFQYLLIVNPQSSLLSDQQQDQLWQSPILGKMIPKYTGRFDKLESELKGTNTLVKKLEEDLFRIRTRDVKSTFRRGYWKVEDGRLRRRVKKVTKDQKRSHSNPDSSLAHTFTVADAHEALRQMWTYEKQQLYEHIQELPKEASEDQFLELVTSVSPQLLATMISSKHAALLYAAQLSDKFILIKFALHQHHNQIQTPLAELKPMKKVGWEPVDKFGWIQGNESLEEYYRRIRDELCRQGNQEVFEKPNGKNGNDQNQELNGNASQEKYNQLSAVFRWFATAYVPEVPDLLRTFDIIDQGSKNPPTGSRSAASDKMPIVKHFHTMQHHGPPGSFKAFSRQQSYTPKLLSSVSYRPRLGGGPLVRATRRNILALSSFLRGFRFLCKRG